jgi:hypothetical protein
VSRFKVTAPRVIASGTTPTAVVVATLRQRGAVLTWVLLDAEERRDLWRLTREHGPFDFADRLPPGTNEEGVPLLVTRAFDPETGDWFEEGGRRLGDWLSGEPLWVSTTYADPALAALRAWRGANPPSSRAIHEPSWSTLTAVRKLALAAGRPDPGKGTGL